VIDRRSICLGAAAALASGGARAATDTPFFVSGPMTKNALAAHFMVPPTSVSLPDTPLLSAQGPRKLSELRGRTWLVSLWAEWCAPCLEEATDLAEIARTHGGPSFGVVFVLTGSGKKLDLAGAQAVMAKRGAADTPLFVEPNGGGAVMKALATQEYDAQMRAITKTDSGPSLPCNLLVDRQGRVRARSFGAAAAVTMSAATPLASKPMTKADKARVLTQHTMWATPAGAEFAAALAAGLLEKA
jgi:thiol-disulfide isomerase/thioredoxin